MFRLVFNFIVFYVYFVKSVEIYTVDGMLFNEITELIIIIIIIIKKI